MLTPTQNVIIDLDSDEDDEQEPLPLVPTAVQPLLSPVAVESETRADAEAAEAIVTPPPPAPAAAPPAITTLITAAQPVSETVPRRISSKGPAVRAILPTRRQRKPDLPSSRTRSKLDAQ